eukprot:m.1092130 g.1092130  ORF g.1092130 m.1092130 type:complete len:1058 (+) comp24292_c0_seq14:153-3326(+)
MPPKSNAAEHGGEHAAIPWQDERKVSQCTRCEVSFSFFKRKHHCRACGQVFCADCAKDYVFLPKVKEKQRVCVFCKAMIEPPAPKSTDSIETDTNETKKRAWFSKKDDNEATRKQSHDSSHSNLRPLRSDTGTNSEKEVIVIKNPQEDFMQFAFISITACLLSPTYFKEETDPKGVWRRSMIKNMMNVLKFHHGESTMEAIMSGEASVQPTPFTERLLAGEGGDPDYNVEQLIQCFLQMCAAEGVYDARARTLLVEFAVRLQVSRRRVACTEVMLASANVQVADDVSDEMKAELALQKRKETRARRWKIGLGTLAGGVLLGVTGGLAAPLLAVGAGAAFGTAAGTALATSGAAIAIGSIFGGAGAGLLAYKTNRRYGSLKEFTFLHVHGEKDNALAVTIAVPGWCTTPPSATDSRYVGVDFVTPVASLDSLSEVYSLVWESRKLYALHVALVTFLTTTLVKQTAVTVLKQTVLVSLVAAIALPATLISASDLIDNPWGVCTESAHAAGCELANVLLSRVQGARPVVLTGYSMGALVIFHALQEMARRSEAVGIVQDVHLFGLPATGQSGAWNAIMPLVSGRVTNFFSENDTFLKLMLRGLSVEKCVAGIEGINHVRCRNVDVSDFISVHSDYAVQMPKLLQLAGLSTTYNDKPFVGNVGDRVAVDGMGLGILRFYGWLDPREPLNHTVPPPAHLANTSGWRSEWLGVALDHAPPDSAVGDRSMTGPRGDGTLRHRRYFDCPNHHAVFLPMCADKVRLVERMGTVGPGSTCASPTCRARSQGSRVSGACYSAICRSSFKDRVKLAPAPDDEAMAEDAAAQTSTAWGKGRLLRQQQREKRNVHDDKISITAEQAAAARLRFTKMDESLLRPTVYTIAFSTDTADWLVERTLTDLQALHRLLADELGCDRDGGFPDDVFIGAVKRQVRLEAWLRRAIAHIPFLRLSSQHMAVGLLGVWLAAPASDTSDAADAPRVVEQSDTADTAAAPTDGTHSGDGRVEQRLQRVAESTLILVADIADSLQPRVARVTERAEAVGAAAAHGTSQHHKAATGHALSTSEA